MNKSLKAIQQELRTKYNYTDCMYRISRKGVPHLWLSYGKLDISVCYFKHRKTFSVWTGCGTPENKLIMRSVTDEGAVDCVKELIGV